MIDMPSHASGNDGTPDADGADDHELAPGTSFAEGTVPTRPLKRSFSIKGHRTSISLEAAFWTALQEIAAEQSNSLAGLVARIDAERGEAGLSSAVRIWVLEYYRGRGSRRSD